MRFLLDPIFNKKSNFLICSILFLLVASNGLIAQKEQCPEYEYILDSLAHYQHHNEYFEHVDQFKIEYGNDSIILNHLDILKGRFYTILQNPDSAAIYLNKAQKYLINLTDTNTHVYADLLEGFARIKVNKRKYAEAKTYYLQAHQIRTETLDSSHLDLPVCPHELGYIALKAGDYITAEEYYLKAVAIKKRYLGDSHPSYGHSLMGLANVYNNNGQYQKAKETYKAAIEIRENSFGRNHPLVAKGLSILGSLQLKMGNYNEAQKLFTESLDIKETTLGKNHPSYASSLHHFAQFYSELGVYDKAEPLYIEAKTIRKNTLGETHPRYAWSLSDLAVLYDHLGQYEKAEKLLKQALVVIENSRGKSHASYARSLDKLARLYRKTKQFTEAEKILKESIETRSMALGKKHTRYANSLNSLANIFIEQQKYQEAEQLLLEAQGIYKEVVGENASDYADNLYSLGNLYFRNNTLDKALDYHTKALDIRFQILGDRHTDFGESIYALAQIHLSNNEIDQAQIKLIQYNQIKKELLLSAFDYLGEREKITYHNRQIGSFNALKAFGLEHPTPEVLEEIYNTILIEKGLHLSSSIETKKFVMAQGDSKMSLVFGELIEYKKKLKRQYDKPLSKRKDVASIKSEIEIREKILARASATFRKELSQRKIDKDQIAKKLKPNSIALEFVCFDVDKDTKKYAAAILDNEGNIKYLDLCTEKDLSALFSNQGNTKDNIAFIYGASQRGLSTPEQPRKTIYELIWKPLEPYLLNTETIYYSPTGLLNRINLSALTEDEVTILADRFKMVRLMSSRTIASSETPSLTNSAYTIGGVDFNIDSTLIKDESKQGNIDLKVAFSAKKGSTQNWDFLKWTKQEVEFINEKLKGAGYKIISNQGQEASEDNFLSLGNTIPSPQVIHLATHGFFLSDKDRQNVIDQEDIVFRLSEHDLLRSGLLMAGANHVWKGNNPILGREDGILTAYEISHMNLYNTELVVLSACETGLGKIKGSEGVYGLQRAFKMAGSKYIIMSLWQIPDRQTSDFMKTFYTNWLDNRMTITDAFNKTQLEMRDRFFDPFAWAGFVLVE